MTGHQLVNIEFEEIKGLEVMTGHQHVNFEFEKLNKKSKVFFRTCRPSVPVGPITSIDILFNERPGCNDAAAFETGNVESPTCAA